METIKVITSVERRRRWSAEDKKAFVAEAEQPGMSISAVARKYGIHPNQLFRWRKLVQEGAFTAVRAGEETFAQLPENCFSVTPSLLPILIKEAFILI
jgi:transposase